MKMIWMKIIEIVFKNKNDVGFIVDKELSNLKYKLFLFKNELVLCINMVFRVIWDGGSKIPFYYLFYYIDLNEYNHPGY